jgi:hypothetical protein
MRSARLIFSRQRRQKHPGGGNTARSGTTPVSVSKIVIDGSQTADDVKAFNNATCYTTISQNIGGILASTITALVFLSRSPITFSCTPELYCSFVRKTDVLTSLCQQQRKKTMALRRDV